MPARRRKPNKHHTVPRQERYVSPKTKWGIALSALGVILVGALVVGFVQGWIQLPEWPRAEAPETIPTEPKDDVVIHITAGGDVNITDKVVASGGSSYDYSDVFLDVLPVFSGSDLTLANFEGNVCGEPYGSEMVSAPTQLLQALRKAGVDVLQTANSQSVSNGLLGLTATANAIRSAGMQSLGTYADEDDFKKYNGYLLYEINGIKIALVAFTKGMDGRSLPEGSESCVNLLYTDYGSTYKSINEDGITKVLKAAAAEEPDITIAMLHWGSEYNDQINTTQKKICTLMQGLGVDAIIGTHPHYVQGIGFDEETGLFIAYSLGDLLGDAEISGTDYAVLLDLEITKDGGTGKTSITAYEYIPIYLHYDEDGSLRLLRIREAMAAYENDYIGKVSSEVYSAMKSALSRIEYRVSG